MARRLSGEDNSSRQRGGQRRGVAGRHEPTALLAHQVAQAAGVRGHHRSPAGHRLQRADPERLAHRGKAIDRAPGEQLRDVSALHTAEHVDSRSHRGGGHAPLHELGQRSLAGDRQAAVRKSPGHQLEGIEQSVYALPWFQSGEEENGPVLPRARVGGRREGPDVDAVGKHAHAGTAGPVQALGGGARREQQHRGPALL